MPSRQGRLRAAQSLRFRAVEHIPDRDTTSESHPDEELRKSDGHPLEDGLIRAERMSARVLPPISDPKQMPDPIDLDVVLTYSDVNKPITIIPPPLPTPTPIPVPAAPTA